MTKTFNPLTGRYEAPEPLITFEVLVKKVLALEEMMKLVSIPKLSV